MMSPRSRGAWADPTVQAAERSLVRSGMLHRSVPSAAAAARIAAAAPHCCANGHSAGLLPPTRPPLRDRRPALPEGMIRITLTTPTKVEFELEVPREATVEDLRERLVELGKVSSTPGEAMAPKANGKKPEEDLRLLFKGVPLKPDTPICELGVCTGSALRLVPGLRDTRTGLHNAAPRGLLMTSDRPWAPSEARKPLTALVLDMEGPYSANLTHPILMPHPPLPMPK
eukprot:TRINITY_DN106373_c0_g1_i1.p1 TRINITY_DN106373_c0_g1~~TRINITY_DN106373_c0_g1_i1.p1  ORF type:complete len:228 (+),score=36.23 TRINITY_DN106373_c0_g1_i1:89-772(+)